MKLKDVLGIVLFIVAVGYMYVFYNGKLTTLESDLASTKAQLKSRKAELQSTSLSLKVYQAEHVRKDGAIDALRTAVKKHKRRLDILSPDDTGDISSEALLEKATGMTEKELRAYLGEPVTILGPESEWWYYKGDRVYDPKTGKRYASVQVLFQGGQVGKVRLKQ